MSLDQPLTLADATIGSPPYMSPEQWRTPGAVGPLADVYALGVLAFESLTGRRPYSAQTIAGYADLHCNGKLPSLGDGFAPALDRFFERALAKQPDARPATALELAAQLRIAAGLGSAPETLPRLDEGVRSAWISDAPQPLAEAVAALDGARNAHQARDGARNLYRSLVRYVLALALAARTQVRGDREEPDLVELLRAFRRRELSDDERNRLMRLLASPFSTRRDAYPIPELVDFVTASDGHPLDELAALQTTSDSGGSDESVRSHLSQIIPMLNRLLRAAGFVLDYALVVPRDGVVERWSGLRRQSRALATLRSTEAVDHQPMLIDRDGRAAVLAWPMIQAIAPARGADEEIFVIDGPGRLGARFISSPSGFEQHDAAVWDWLGEHVVGGLDAAEQTSADDRPPFLGLAAFSDADAARFFGREREIDAFMNRLRRQPFQLVVGASGVGKSSFVQAGIVPMLPPGSRTITIRPGAKPIATLATRLTAVGITAADIRPLLEAAPAAAVSLVAHAAGDSVITIVVDQLEELFTLCTDVEERERFGAILAELGGHAGGRTRAICTVRDDFLMNVEGLASLRALVSPGVFLLGNPSRSDLERTLVEPARRAGYELSDPQLAREMVDAVADRPGALALLSFAASRLWELRDRRFHQLTRKAYDAMGGIGGALGHHAEATLASMTGDEQRLSREIFRHMVTAEGTRAVLSVAELRQRLASARADVVVDKLVTARLVSVGDTDEAVIEIIHEALIGAWPRLQQWVREDSDGARMREQLRTAARQWDERRRPRGQLWRDDTLVDLQRWLRNKPALTELEAAFADASGAAMRRSRRIRNALGVAAFAILGIAI
ncbi:MAG TPA: hypothetical protein VGO00_06250, partial [Kofleriaceae bacterium]|nr:hypothetical protein [Kofleriaceae bacterium]